MIFEILCLIALSFGGFAGLIALVNPKGISSTLRLQAEPRKPGGFAEFRATFGGVFFMIHLVGFGMILSVNPAYQIYVAAPIAAGWLGAALARLLSLVVDKAENGEGGINRYWVVLEFVVAGLIASVAFAN